MFVSFKNSRTFAATQTKSFNATLSVLATFNGNTATTDVVANDIGYQFPAVCYAVKFANTLGRVERDSLFSFSKLTFNFCSQMTKSTKIANFTNNSSGESTFIADETSKNHLQNPEVWKNIPDYDGIYQISNYGNVKSLKRKSTSKGVQILKPTMNKGYRMISLSKNGIVRGFRIARLVAFLFCENPENKTQVDHIDGNKTNDFYLNLRWVTPKENSNNPITIENTKRSKLGNKNFAYIKSGLLHNQSVPVYQISLKGEILKLYGSISEAVRDGFIRYRIDECCNHLRDNDGEYKWEYADSLAGKGYYLLTKETI